MAFTLPLPRTPAAASGAGGPSGRARRPQRTRQARWARWYENELGWAVEASGDGAVHLVTGLRFDVLELPSDAGAALLERTGLPGPVALAGARVRLLVAPGAADELPGLLDWLEWSGVDLALTALGAGGRMAAPPPPGWPAPSERAVSRGAAVWLRPPEPGCAMEPLLPALAPFGPGGGLPGGRAGVGSRGEAAAVRCPDRVGASDLALTPDLVRVVGVAATECFRARLRRTRNSAVGGGASRGASRANTPRGNGQPQAVQPLAFS
ncbi:SCO3374 family protein [Streptomyces sp. HNM0663]|uniref:SCO3374 family protein n=1 Tax=Streptomyces chengmaiensis TaxID=3040919 RepID=A0ABT6HFU1_9ACTN|nr:SCO3374 family protein [Streptomyces chengmaiensis]MDH2387548.1 SCO3374 family protein [Streptomyces chengmaiensis]